MSKIYPDLVKKNNENCPNCGSSDLYKKGWVELKTLKVKSYIIEEIDGEITNKIWCDGCNSDYEEQY